MVRGGLRPFSTYTEVGEGENHLESCWCHDVGGVGGFGAFKGWGLQEKVDPKLWATPSA